MRHFIAAVCCAVASQPPSASSPLVWGSLTPGPHPVGVRVVATRGLNPVRMIIWYPSARGAAATPVSFAEYVRFAQEAAIGETRPEALRTSLSEAMSANPTGVPEPILDRLLASPTAAVRDAPRTSGRFPLVLWGARHATMLAQSVMSEYLASHGYVVAFAHAAGPPRPLPYQVEAADEKAETIRLLVGDLESALAHLRAEPDVDRREIAAMTWSYAGESAMLLQTRNADVDLVIGLSSNVLDGWVYQPAEALAKLDGSTLGVPYVLMTEKVGTNGRERMPPVLLDALPKGGYVVTFPRLAHGNFNAIEGLIPALVGVERVPRWSKAGPDARAGYETISRFVLHFLDAQLKAHELDLVKGWDWRRGLADDFVTVEARGRGPRR